MHPHQLLRKLHWHLGVVFSLTVFTASPAYAAPTTFSNPSAISQSYQTSSTNITQGTLVSLVSSGSTNVEPADTGTASTLVGIAANKPVLELSNGSSSSIQVVTSGVTETLVSDANGTIKAGDRIAPSPVAGIGMKAIQSGEVVGTAQKSLSSVSTITQHVTGSNGQNVTIKVGLIPVAVNVVYYSTTAASGAVSSIVPPFLQNLANALTGKQVSPLRVLLGGAALLLGFLAITVMLYVAIKSGMISIGRNPLAEAALRRGLVDVIVAAMGVLVVTVVVVYGVLVS
jgi:hypothetical protein